MGWDERQTEKTDQPDTPSNSFAAILSFFYLSPSISPHLSSAFYLPPSVTSYRLMRLSIGSCILLYVPLHLSITVLDTIIDTRMSSYVFVSVSLFCTFDIDSLALFSAHLSVFSSLSFYLPPSLPRRTFQGFERRRRIQFFISKFYEKTHLSQKLQMRVKSHLSLLPLHYSINISASVSKLSWDYESSCWIHGRCRAHCCCRRSKSLLKCSTCSCW